MQLVEVERVLGIDGRTGPDPLGDARRRPAIPLGSLALAHTR
jgi:hypothetical protein